MTTARAGASILRGTKATDKKTEQQKECTECDLHKAEDERHRLIDFTYKPWVTLREECENSIIQAWSEQQWDHYKGQEGTMQTLILLGLPLQDKELRQNPQAWNKRDLAVKHMLQEVDPHRMKELGRAPMTGIALHQRTGEEWRIILENKTREYNAEKAQMRTQERESKEDGIQQIERQMQATQAVEEQYDTLMQ
jgi:hypothetical protein